MHMEQAKKFDQQAPQAKAAATKVAAPEDDGAPLPEDGLTPNHVSMVMDHCNCSRNKAIRVLRETNDDLVQAVRKLTNWVYQFALPQIATIIALFVAK